MKRPWTRFFHFNRNERAGIVVLLALLVMLAVVRMVMRGPERTVVAVPGSKLPPVKKEDAGTAQDEADSSTSPKMVVINERVRGRGRGKDFAPVMLDVVDVNSAPAEALMRVTGMDAALAAYVADYVREKGGLTDAKALARMIGAGPAGLQKYRKQLVIRKE